ncbi:MAG: NADH-quinone oxidoreductase subunit K [Verrucomicrobia bacterium]|nr:NADH-quinone oxidoreductase subunit K [Verrucomicrobiota bacterium]
MTLPPGALLYALAGVWITVIGLRGVLAEEDWFRKIVGANVMGSGVFLLLVALARRAPDGPPDPVPHGMILTGLVVAVSATALMLALLGFLNDRENGEDDT